MVLGTMSASKESGPSPCTVPCSLLASFEADRSLNQDGVVTSPKAESTLRGDDMM